MKPSVSKSNVPRKGASSTRQRRRYYSRHRYSSRKCMLSKQEYKSLFSPWGILWGSILLLAPISYLYIIMVLVRELFGEHLLHFGHQYAPLLQQWILASAIKHIPTSTWMPHDRLMDDSSPLTAVNDTLASGSGFTIPLVLDATAHMRTPRQWLWLWIEVWCYLEALFYILLRARIHWLQRQDPLEASFSAAPLMELSERAALFRRMMDCETGMVVQHISGWFFDHDCREISAYDVRDFVAWSMFEGRHQEHLTEAELEQLEDFVEELQHRISLELYGAASDESLPYDTSDTESEDDSEMTEPEWRSRLPQPKKMFQFPAETQNEAANNFFSELFESYRRCYDQIDFRPVKDLRNIVQKAAGENFHPVQDLKNLVAETAQQIADVDPMATASQKASQFYESLIPSGSMVDKQLHASYDQMIQAWNSVKAMNDQRRLETARFLSQQRQRLQQQAKAYRVMLGRMRGMSSGVPSKQMASLMRRITECYEAMEGLEGRAQTAFVQVTGIALKNIPFLQPKEPQRYAKYSSDPIMSMATYPLSFHLLLLGCTEIPLRVKMQRRGFERRCVGPVTYYFHPGLAAMNGNFHEENEKLPVVFVHGIGIGLIVYMPLIDALLQTGRPIYLPEIPYVSGFRPWQSSHAVLPPAVVTSTMVAMLATHGHLSATWMGHSYGTSWLSYMVQYAPEAVAAVMFLDPICFCLHMPRLTKSFVYTKPDIGTVSYIVRTDIIVNRTIQRSFPWARIILFYEQIHVPCLVVLSEKDALVPSEKVEEYLSKKDVPVQDFESLRRQLEILKNSPPPQPSSSSSSSSSSEDADHGNDSDTIVGHNRSHVKCIVFRGAEHGEWTEKPSLTIPTLAYSAEDLCLRAEEEARNMHLD